MENYVTNDDLKAALRESADWTKAALRESADWTKAALRESAEWTTNLLLGELGTRFNEVNLRLDRIDATLVNHTKQLAAGARAIAGFNEWTSKADADYVRVLAELSELKIRVQKLESQ